MNFNWHTTLIRVSKLKLIYDHNECSIDWVVLLNAWSVLTISDNCHNL